MAKILVVEDNPAMRQIYRLMLNKNGYDVVAETADGREAIKLYTSTDPDLVILDHRLLSLEGIDVAKILLELDPTARIILCSSDSDKLKSSALKLGILSVLQKPFNYDQFIATVGFLLEKTPDKQ
ncbi:response regulator [Paenibacillus physcomitrellae]|uniref:Response regulator n=1 Tax=Paenibacillus physcomitrellae TaxID=1619311 RepID=A0ABQ1FR01_9BACL|nr:response regulator [Paenibacillus physcomitrellae]GGA26192.1 response regulator [Paenibacillus physcomitrellae]